MLRLKLKSFIADERGAYTIEYSLVLLMSATATITGYTKAVSYTHLTLPTIYSV